MATASGNRSTRVVVTLAILAIVGGLFFGASAINSSLHGKPTEVRNAAEADSKRPSASSSPSTTASATPSASASPSPSDSATPTPSGSPSDAPSASRTADPDDTPSARASASHRASKSARASSSPTASPKHSSASPAPKKTYSKPAVPAPAPVTSKITVSPLVDDCNNVWGKGEGILVNIGELTPSGSFRLVVNGTVLTGSAESDGFGSVVWNCKGIAPGSYSATATDTQQQLAGKANPGYGRTTTVPIVVSKS